MFLRAFVIETDFVSSEIMTVPRHKILIGRELSRDLQARPSGHAHCLGLGLRLWLGLGLGLVIKSPRVMVRVRVRVRSRDLPRPR